MSVNFLNLDSARRRVVLLMVVVLFAVGVCFFVKWELANTISSGSQYKEVAELAVDLAPSDPQTHYVWAGLLEKTFLPEDLPKSLAEYENAAALSPNNYLMWLSLGKARGRAGDAAGAENALRKAQELAPNYAQIQWTLGNLLLRRQKFDEGFTQIRKAAENDPNYTNPAVLAAWQLYDGDLVKIRQAIGDSAFTNAALAVFLVKQNKFEEAVQIWNSLPAESKKNEFKASGQELFSQFTTAKKYLEAQQVANQISQSQSADSVVGEISNGGFETDVKLQNPGIFEWQIADAQQPQIGYDNQQKHGGERSLKMIFNSNDGKDFRAISQTVTVEAGKTYDFSAFYKSDLKTNSTFVWEISDAADGKLLASTDSSEAKNADWSKIQTKFTVSVPTEAVVVRLARVPCKAAICPISGGVLFDDFNLTKNN